MNKFAFVFFFFLFGIGCCHAQLTEHKQIKSSLLELGFGYPISFSNSKSYVAFFNIGYQKPITEKYFVGLLLSPQIRLNAGGDFTLGSKIRFGKLVSTNKNISLGLGYTIYSARQKLFPGLAVEFNYDKTNEYGFHIKYEEFNSENYLQERNITLGLHLASSKFLRNHKAIKLEQNTKPKSRASAFPVIVGIAGFAGVMAILIHIASRSK